MICPRCNKAIPDDSAFCQYCGFQTAPRAEEKPFDTATDTNHPAAVSPGSNPVNPAPGMAQYAPLARYCSRCGGLIDRSSRRCTACGRQYFRPASAVPVIVLSVLLAISVGLNIRQYVIHSNMTETVANLEAEIAEQEESINNLWWDYLKLSNETDFFRSHAVIVPDDGTNLYHLYRCEDLDLSSFWIYNTEAAKQQGLQPCPKCYP